MKLDEITLEWEDQASDHDFNASETYLSLLLDERRAKRAVGCLRVAKVTTRRVNDILRACRRDPLPLSDTGVDQALYHVLRRQKLAPPLVLSMDYGAEICDGYHRVSLAYAMNAFMEVPVVLAHISDLDLRR